MNLTERKKRGKSYTEHFLSFNATKWGPRYLIVARQKVEGLPPVYSIVSGCEDKEKAETEVSRLNSLMG